MNWAGSSERLRVTICAAVGLSVAAVVAFATVWQLALLAGWIVTATVLVVATWRDLGRLDPTVTAQVATREDDSRAASRAVLVAASVVSLGAIVFALHLASSSDTVLKVALTASSLTSVIVSWLVVNTVFVLRYAHLYYGGEGVGGVEFPGGEAPCYRDFAYLGFTVGMTFQVSDTAITDRIFRATVLRHALLAYLFSIAIIGLTINVIAGFFR
jgi:uncharacterized membrane protein